MNNTFKSVHHLGGLLAGMEWKNSYISLLYNRLKLRTVLECDMLHRHVSTGAQNRQTLLMSATA